MSESPYNGEFYSDQAAGSERSARVVLPLVFGLLQPNSCIDVGCGIGTWTKVAIELGLNRVIGLDGAYVPASQLLIDQSQFTPADLASNLPTGLGNFDLALCLEVAEHLPKDRAEGFISELCGLSDAVLFSAAIPGQGGTDHVNEQWPSWWSNLFSLQDFMAFDAVRPQIWSNADVDFFYRQNVILYIRRSRADLVALATARVGDLDLIIDAVHPEQYERVSRKLAKRVGARPAARSFVAAVQHKARSILTGPK